MLTSHLEGRIAIVLPRENSPEAVLLQERLYQEKIQFTSSCFRSSSIQTCPVINAWCQWQKSDHIDDYFQWIQSFVNEDILSISVKKELEKEVSKSVTSLGTHRSGLLLDWILSKTKNDTLRFFLKTCNLLPVEAQIHEFPTFLPKNIISFSEQELLPLRFLEKKCSRHSFIEFLETSLQESASQRVEKFSSSFAKVCLLSPEEALYGTWASVFFFHCVEQAPRPWDDNPWIHRAHWQSQLRRDHPQIFSPEESTSLLLKNHNRKCFSLRFLRKIQKECSDKKNYFFAALSNGNLLSLPFNLFFLENYADRYGSFQKLGFDASASVTKKSALKTNLKRPFPHLKKIYQDRRNPQNPFGAWDYSLEAPLREHFSFSCKTWESILQNPEDSWYRHILQQEPCPIFAEQEWIKLARGIWVHEFLSFLEIFEEARDMLDLIESYAHIGCQAHSFKEKIETFLSVHGTELTSIWEITWNEALSLSRQLFQRVALMGNSPKFRSEFTLPQGSRLQFSSGASLPLTGRIDLWLQEETQSCIIDYKTGGDMALRGKKWINVKSSKGKVASAKGLQLVLYGIALQVKGGQNIQLLILKPDSPMGDALNGERVDLKTLLKEDSFCEFLRIFEYIVSHGVLGLRPSSYASQQPLKRPLAVLPIEDNILQKRCIKTFTCLWN
ncbi:MAG: PD-(D/E)XK nuclease family protein [Puniceicoccales bacterium]|nr:PD-(D/E)XK nuclease family protein [Puniceicoccales bacterium]